MFRTINRTNLTALSLTAAAAGTALPTAEADAAYVVNTSWNITVSNDPIGCPGTATVTASFRFRKAPFGGGLAAGSLDVSLYDADGDGLFGTGDDEIANATVTWADQDANFVDLTVEFEVDCIETDGDWCTIRGNAGTDDEGDPHEMYIYVEQPDSGALWNNSWTSPKNRGNWIKYTFPLRCGCDEEAGESAEYDVAHTPDGRSSALALFDLGEQGPDAPPLEYFQAFFEYDTDLLGLQEIVPLANGLRASDVFGQPEIQPGTGGVFVGLPVIDPIAALELQAVGIELQLQQLDPQAFGGTRIRHLPQQTAAFFGDGTTRSFDPTDGEIPLRPFDLQPPMIEPGLILPPLPGEPLVGQPGAVTDNLDPLFPGGQIELDIAVLDPNQQVIFETLRPADPDGSFVIDPGPLPTAGFLALGATDAAGNRSDLLIPFAGPCNPADVSPPFGTLDLSDINAFVNGFTAQNPVADLNNDGVYDLADINLFVNAFLAGCP